MSLNNLPVTGGLGLYYPVGSTPITGSDSDANAQVVATLAAGGAAVRTYILGFQVTGLGATAGLGVTVVVDIGTATLSFAYAAVAGVLLPNTPLIITFPAPIAADALNTPITVTCPALGAGNTLNAVNAFGFQL